MSAVQIAVPAAVKSARSATRVAATARHDARQYALWVRLLVIAVAVGFLGLFIAFGHSILAMSGEETLAQVYREVEAPKLLNFKRAAFIVFVYSLVLTAGISFLAVLLIPDEVRMKFYQDNLIGGLARHVIGPDILKLCLETFVVGVGFLGLSAYRTWFRGSPPKTGRDLAEEAVADLEKLAVDDKADVDALQGWRRRVFGEDALRLKRGELALVLDGARVRVVELEPEEG